MTALEVFMLKKRAELPMNCYLERLSQAVRLRPKFLNCLWLGWVLVAGILILAVGCAPKISPPVQAQAAAAQVVEDTYQLGPEDALEISVWKEPDLTKQLVIRPDGKISYPLIGEIQAAGKTVKQLRQEISKRLEKYVTDAQVTVLLLKAQHYKIYVVGKVNKPGEFLVGRPANVMQALAMAGGLTPFASPHRIIIIRRLGDKEQTLPFDYKAVSRGQFLDQNVTLLPGDVVVVP
jgi:polysaccharide export outer membrane protein